MEVKNQASEAQSPRTHSKPEAARSLHSENAPDSKLDVYLPIEDIHKIQM